MEEQEIKKFDYLIIGAGSGGIGSGRWVARNFKKSVCIIEHKRLGGTCVNVGCVPKKVMFNLASFVDDVNHAMESYGINLKSHLSINWDILKKNRDSYIQRLNKIYGEMIQNNGMTLVKGFGKFISNKVVECQGQKYTADHILIATGSVAQHQEDFDGIEHAINSDGFFDLEKQPKSVIILGGGYIGIELGQIFHSLGTKVIHLVRMKILNFLDDDVRDNLMKNMKTYGYDIRTRKNIKRIQKLENGEFLVTITNLLDGKDYTEQVELVLIATGRIANTKELNLKSTEIKLNSNGSIRIDEYENTTVEGVYALGDVANQIQLTPTAIRAGRILGERIFGGKKKLKTDYTNIPTVIFSHPPVGVIGFGEQEAIQRYGQENVVVYKSEFNNMFFSLIEDKNLRESSLFKIICLKNESEKVIGVHANGRSVDEMMQGIGIAIKMGATKKDFDRCVAIHPTASEEFVITDPKYEEDEEEM